MADLTQNERYRLSRLRAYGYPVKIRTSCGRYIFRIGTRVSQYPSLPEAIAAIRRTLETPGQ